ncbi:MAG TPA: FAD-dependent oxidoreductase [Hyphomicrobiaceae bacterium]|nr:FAD-dependent oxidoreductase [Hyphomicrobiaceae bacterium]
MSGLKIHVVGGGITGLWQALTLVRRGHRVRLIEASAVPFAESASRFAGAMLAPYCEAEAAEPIVRELGLQSLAIWRQTYPGLVDKGTLVVAGVRDRAELVRFARMTEGFETLDAEGVDALEPGLDGRFAAGLHYPNEAHMAPLPAMHFLLDAARASGAEILLGAPWSGTMGDADYVIDCRGLAARHELPRLRGVRGERIVVRTLEVRLSRSIRLLHPRQPLYVVPWPDGLFMIGATVIESEDQGPATVRSALELLGAAYALHPAFGEAEIVDVGAGVRPALPDNVPKIIVRGRTIHVNGLYRHGFLMAPALAALVAAFLDEGKLRPGVIEAA